MRGRLYRALIALLLLASLVILSQPFFHVSFTPLFLQELSLFASPVPASCSDGKLFDYSGFSLLSTGLPEINRACLPDLQLHSGDGLGWQWPVVVFTVAMAGALAVTVLAAPGSRWFDWGTPVALVAAAAGITYENASFWSQFAGRAGALGADSTALMSQASWPAWAEIGIAAFLFLALMVPRAVRAAKAAIRPID